jgi:hypothetical protein
MSSPLDSYTNYSRFIYNLLADRVTVDHHTLAVYPVGRTVGIMRGHIVFHSDHMLRVFEQIDFVTHRILKYMYELIYHDKRLWWYDPMPHPDILELQSTHPHHKHVLPDIKHHRIPAPELSFTEPNLPQLLTEVEAMIGGKA